MWPGPYIYIARSVHEGTTHTMTRTKAQLAAARMHACVLFYYIQHTHIGIILKDTYTICHVDAHTHMYNAHIYAYIMGW